MAKKTNKSTRSNSVPMALLTGVGVSMAVTVLGAGVTAWAIISEWITQNSTGFAAWIILSLAAGLGALTSASVAGKQKLQMCLLTGGIYFLLLVSITAVFFDGQYNGLLINAVIILSATAVVSLVGIRRGNSVKRRPWKKAYR